MEELKDLCYLINRYQVQEVNVITNPKRKAQKSDARYWEFYGGLRDGRWKTDEEAAAYFGMDAKSKQFNRLKNELKERLLDTMLFIDPQPSPLNEYVTKHQQLAKWFSQAQVLYRKSGSGAFFEVGYRCLKLALELEHTPTIVEMARMLATLVAVRPQLHKEFNYLSDLIATYGQALQAEINLQLDYERLMFQFSKEKGFKAQYAGAADVIVEKYAEAAPQMPYPGFQGRYQLARLYAQTIRHNWKEALAIAQEAETQLKNKKVINYPLLILFTTQKISCQTMLGHYEAARKSVSDAMQIAVEGSPNWFKCYSLSAVNELYAEMYADAWATVREVMKHERFNTLSVVDQESWRLYYGYLRLLIQRGKVPLPADERSKIKKFRLQTWLNDLNWLSVDKRGSNIPVQLLQIHFLLLENRFDELENRVEALRKYRQRNLDSNSEHFRTDIMLRLTELLPKYYHDLRQLQQQAAPLLEKLSSVPVDLLDRTFEIEVIPYERQWNWMLAEIAEEYTEDPSVRTAELAATLDD